MGNYSVNLLKHMGSTTKYTKYTYQLALSVYSTFVENIKFGKYISSIGKIDKIFS